MTDQSLAEYQSLNNAINYENEHSILNLLPLSTPLI